MKKRALNDIKNKAIQRGYDPHAKPRVLTEEHLKDAPRSGAPQKLLPTDQEVLIQYLTKDKEARESTYQYLRDQFLVSA